MHLGYPHPDYLLQHLTARQLNGWFTYNQIEPFGEIWSDIRHGQQMAFTANLNRDSKTRPEPFKPEEFMNFYAEEDREYTTEELEAEMTRIFGV